MGNYPEWWKHLRWTKLKFWKRHRQAEKRLGKTQIKERLDDR